MCSRLIKYTAALLLTVAASTAQAARQDTLCITLEQLFGMGTENSLKLDADRLKELAAHERSRTARTSAMPVIEAGLKGGVLGQPVVFRNGLSNPEKPETPDWQQNYALDISQPLYHGGRIKYAIRQADMEKELAALQTANDMADVKLALLQRYLELFVLYKQNETLARNIEEYERRLKDIRRMKQEGLITNNDVLRSEMQLTDSQLAQTETQNDIRLASQHLDILLGIDESTMLMPDTSLLSRTFATAEYAACTAQAYESDPAMKVLRKETELARNNMKLVKAGLMPRLSLYASNTLARPVSRTLADMYNNNWNIGLSLSYTISDAYAGRHKIKEAARMMQLRQNAEEQKRQEIRMEVQTALLKHREAAERVEALKLSVKQAEENCRIMSNRYYNQMAILTDLLDADNLRLNAELQLTSARTQVIYTYYRLMRATGAL